MIYSTVVLSFATLVLIGLLMFLVPVFANIFKTLNGHLPMLTQYVVMASNVVRHQWFILFPGIGLTIWAIRRYKRIEQGRKV